jgi:putative methionine-R-sulfoxide reductase with GAF domain
MATHEDLLQQVTTLAATSSDATTLMQRIADHVHSAMPRYNSISFRVIDPANPGMLVLGPYTGSFTPQKRLAFGQGLCGTAAATEKTIVVNNVEADGRYLRASTMVKSEIVSPILVKGKFAALIDIQSYFVDTFKSPDDQSFVESCARIIAKFMETKPI